MASGHRKPLYADLFKPPPKPKIEIPASWTSISTSTSTSSWTHSLLSCDSSSSSSGFSTPPSSASDDDGGGGDFMGELTRQMAEECMLQEDDDQFEAHDSDPNCRNDINRWNSSRMPSFQVYELKNQLPVKKPGRRRRVKGAKSDSAQSQPQLLNGYYPGSGMQAVYLGRSGSAGTGVFLPRVNGEAAPPEPVREKKKSVTGTGCPIVLIPTRVLQVLHSHFDQLQQSKHPCPKEDESMIGSEDMKEEEEIELPKEWTYTLD